MAFVALDVECAATGRGHNDRAPCRVAVVDFHGGTLLDELVAVPGMVSPLTAITGLTTEQIEGGRPYDDVVADVKALLGPHVTVVGQAPFVDIEWLGLRAGVDFRESIDIAEHFRTWNNKYGNYDYYSLAMEVYALLGIRMNGSHSPVEDAQLSMTLFREYVRNRQQLERARRTLQQHRYGRKFPQFKDPDAPYIDGVCDGKFNAKRCICGQPVVTR
ncbi:REX4 [Symbiodinium sp. CCMP2456]|nr:REX4 [Symbiodinium sp. CCMP2456]